MALRVNRTLRVVGWIAGGVLFAVLGIALAFGPIGTGGNGTIQESSRSGGVAPQVGAPDQYGGQATGSDATQDSAAYSDSMKSEAASPQSVTDGGSASPGSMIIRTAMLDIEVDKVDDSLDSIRRAASRYSADIEQLTLSGGRQTPRPLTSPDAGYPTPTSATVVLRVPAEKLAALTADLEKLGTVTSQSSSSDDVTQQYVDLDARLKNLKTEESRLRGFFSRASKVEDLLAVERELSRVRGEIEAMQAQVDYLKRQVARSTLTVNLTEPGPVIQPTGANWGFTEAIRRGIQGAAALLTALITVVIAVAPLAVIIILAWLLVRWLVNRRRVRRMPGRDEPAAEERE